MEAELNRVNPGGPHTDMGRGLQNVDGDGGCGRVAEEIPVDGGIVRKKRTKKKNKKKAAPVEEPGSSELKTTSEAKPIPRTDGAEIDDVAR